eukprot:s739_g3.t1
MPVLEGIALASSAGFFLLFGFCSFQRELSRNRKAEIQDTRAEVLRCFAASKQSPGKLSCNTEVVPIFLTTTFSHKLFASFSIFRVFGHALTLMDPDNPQPGQDAHRSHRSHRPRRSDVLPSLAWRLVFVAVSLGWLDPPSLGPTFTGSSGRIGSQRQRPLRSRSVLGTAGSGWQRLNKRASWDFLLGASPFSYEEGVHGKRPQEVVDNVRQEEYMKNLLWVDDFPDTNNEIVDNDVLSAGPDGPDGPDGDAPGYPAPFVSYLARLLLARDERCAKWWQSALSVGTDSQRELFFRFEASVAKTLRERWHNLPGALATALIKRFGGRFPFDAEQQIRLCFGLLPEDTLRGSFFDQNFTTDRDEVMEVFLAIDQDGNGMLTRKEIEKAFMSLGDGWLSNPEMEQMLEDALADSNGEVDVSGFKSAIASSVTAARARQAQGIPDTEWWKDPAALVPAPLLETATPELLREAHERFLQQAEQKAKQPLMRERPLSLRVYALYTLAGALACTVTHVALVPIDVVKTLQQTEPSHYGHMGLIAGAQHLRQESGTSALFLGVTPTLAGYAWYGASVFPGYEFFKRKLMEILGPRRAARLRILTILLAGALATFVACIGVCPAEAVRIRTVAERGFQTTFMGSLSQLFAGFPPLLLRQVFFGMAKFLVFDTVAAMIYRQFPWLHNRKRNSSLVSMFSGALAGFISTLVSQPADAILTRLAAVPQLGIATAALSLWQEGRIGAFFVGFSARAIFAALIIGGQFLLYDVAKRLFRVTHADLSQRADVLTTALRTEKLPMLIAEQGAEDLTDVKQPWPQGQRPKDLQFLAFGLVLCEHSLDAGLDQGSW